MGAAEISITGGTRMAEATGEVGGSSRKIQVGHVEERQQLRGRMRRRCPGQGPEEANRRESNTGEVWLDLKWEKKYVRP